MTKKPSALYLTLSLFSSSGGWGLRQSELPQIYCVAMDDLELLVLLCWVKSGTSPPPALKPYFENFYCTEKLK